LIFARATDRWFKTLWPCWAVTVRAASTRQPMWDSQRFVIKQVCVGWLFPSVA
jgi:hypothetical protein